MTPERSDNIRASSPKGTTREADLGQDRADVDFWCRSSRRSTANFGQVGHLEAFVSIANHWRRRRGAYNKVGVGAHDVNIAALEFFTERSRPSCEPGLGSRVDSKHGRDGGDSGEGSDRDNEAALPADEPDTSVSR